MASKPAITPYSTYLAATISRLVLMKSVLRVAFGNLPYLLLAVIWYWPLLSRNAVGIFDWKKELYFLQYIHAWLVRYGSVPQNFFALPADIAWYPTVSVTQAVFPNPELITLSPFYLLFPWLSLGSAIKLLVFGHLAIGVFGTVLLSRHAQLPTLLTVFAVVLFPLNPWFIQHIAIGYTPWITMWLLPLALRCLNLSKAPVGVSSTAVLLALMLYQGGLHVFVWSAMMLCTFGTALALIAGKREFLARSVASLLLAVALSWAKVSATAALYSGWTREINQSYSSFRDLWGLLFDSSSDPYKMPESYALYGTNFYDASLAVGACWLALLALAVVWHLLRILKAPRPVSYAHSCIAAMFAFVALGWNGIWSGLTEWAPFLSAEKYPYRFLTLSMWVGSVLILLFLREMFRQPRPRYVTAILSALCLGVCVQSYTRNQTFAAPATATPLSNQRNAVFKQLHDLVSFEQAGGRKLRWKLMGSGLEVTLPRDEGNRIQSVNLPWLSASRIREFECLNCSLVVNPQHGTSMLRPNGEATTALLQPRSFVDPFAAGISITAFAVASLLVMFCFDTRKLRRCP